ncbi:MAG: imidazoleglycerol-phosphate dehydratase [Candidatus Altiarchaeales archaeon WOR_SM1_86-2]|nr:MAG: imidazoleglycerol-phosphate dehydratase [Candidatus Altiarchaeales archaeon WOR_SM1_86-2]
MRTSKISRKTKETDIELELNLDGGGKAEVNTPVNFLNHMLENLSKHSRFDLKINAKGDVEVDDHHTVEDIAICLGQALDKALGDKKGIARMGHAIVPMDDSLATAAVDLSGRGYGAVDLGFLDPFEFYDPFDEDWEGIAEAVKEVKIGDLSKENVEHFLETLAVNGKFNLNVSVFGENDHHKVEACFKALAKALYDATRIIDDEVVSTKGVV